MVKDAVLKEAAKIMLAYAGTFLLAISFQVAMKISAIRNSKADKAKKDSKTLFNRYMDSKMLAGDRCVGNWLEWSVAFLIVFWLNVLLTGNKHLNLGWVYVASRTLYPFIAVNGGIVPSVGATPRILIATIPGYYAIFCLAYHAYQAL
jgi:hypothetical protein